MKKLFAILVVLVVAIANSYSATTTFTNDVTIAKDEIIPDGETWVYEKSLTIDKDYTFTVGKNSILIVKGDFTLAIGNGSGSKISTLALSENSIVNIKGNANFNGKVTGQKTHMSELGGTNGSILVVEGTIQSNVESGFPKEYFDEVEAYGETNINGVNVSSLENVPEYVRILLPIELTYFTVEQKGNDIVFEWETATETNNDYFTIEYSIDGVNFYELTTKAGSGTTSEATSYNFVWNADKSGLFYFRLKQTDYNGEYSYSKVVALNFNKETIQGIYFQKGKIMYNGNPLRL